MAEQFNVEDFAGFESGGFLGVPVAFKNVRFGVDPRYTDENNNPVPVLLVDLVNDDGDIRENQILSLGKGFEIGRGGAEVTATSKYAKGLGFAAGSKLQTFLNSLMELDAEALRKRAIGLQAGPRTATFWEGLAIVMVEQEIEFGKPGPDGKKKSFKQPKAVEFIGFDGLGEQEEQEEKKPVKKAAPKRAPRAKKAPDANATLGIDKDVFKALLDLAKDADTFEDFLSEAYETDFIDDDDVQAVVDDEDSGIWAQR